MGRPVRCAGNGLQNAPNKVRKKKKKSYDGED